MIFRCCNCSGEAIPEQVELATSHHWIGCAMVSYDDDDEHAIQMGGYEEIIPLDEDE